MTTSAVGVVKIASVSVSCAQLDLAVFEGRRRAALTHIQGGERMPPQLVTEDLAAYWTGRPAATIRRWAAEGRLTRHYDRTRRRNGVLYDLAELPEARRDSDTRALITPAATPDVIETPLLAA
jgi:hypothetical protein